MMQAPPYGAEASAVRKLALDVAAEGARPGQRAPRVSDHDVESWIRQGGQRVAVRISRAALLPRTPALALGGQLDQETVEGMARHLVELYAAALLADVTHPERARGDNGYGQLLQKRFDDGLKDLAYGIEAGISIVVAPDVAVGDRGPMGVFPPPGFRRDTGF